MNGAEQAKRPSSSTVPAESLERKLSGPKIANDMRRTIETSAARVIFTGGSVSPSSDSDLEDSGVHSARGDTANNHHDSGDVRNDSMAQTVVAGNPSSPPKGETPDPFTEDLQRFPFGPDNRDSNSVAVEEAATAPRPEREAIPRPVALTDSDSSSSSSQLTTSSPSHSGQPTAASPSHSRANPFNKIPDIQEDHFNAKTPMFSGKDKRGFPAPQKYEDASDNEEEDEEEDEANSSLTVDYRASRENSFGSSLDYDISVELGLTEDHFSQPEGFFGFTKMEELELAIESCKQAVAQADLTPDLTPENKEYRNELVKKLVQLRLKLQELKDGPEEEDKSVKLVAGHRFHRSKHGKRKGGGALYCESCMSSIWPRLQSWYKCSECGVSAHSKCINYVTRTCPSSKISEASYIFAICPETGLSRQNYKCAECRRSISFRVPGAGSLAGGGEARLCDYTGHYYCSECHWQDSALIPARVTHNWDFEPRTVCRQCKKVLDLLAVKPIIRVEDTNPVLFNYVEELAQVKKLREEILMMKKYFISCKSALESKLLLQLQEHQHFVENSSVYSLQELADIEQGSLPILLAHIHISFAKHIKVDCQLCQAKGFICELCGSDNVLFPFDLTSTSCPQCKAVFHRDCFNRPGVECPKCARLALRKASAAKPQTDNSDPDQR